MADWRCNLIVDNSYKVSRRFFSLKRSTSRSSLSTELCTISCMNGLRQLICQCLGWWKSLLALFSWGSMYVPGYPKSISLDRSRLTWRTHILWTKTSYSMELMGIVIFLVVSWPYNYLSKQFQNIVFLSLIWLSHPIYPFRVHFWKIWKEDEF